MGLDGNTVAEGARWAKGQLIRAFVIAFFVALGLGAVIGSCANHVLNVP